MFFTVPFPVQMVQPPDPTRGDVAGSVTAPGVPHFSPHQLTAALVPPLPTASSSGSIMLDEINPSQAQLLRHDREMCISQQLASLQRC